jgi:hypothetical protein
VEENIPAREKTAGLLFHKKDVRLVARKAFIDSKNHVSVLETVAILKILNFGSNVASRVFVSVLNSSIYHWNFDSWLIIELGWQVGLIVPTGKFDQPGRAKGEYFDTRQRVMIALDGHDECWSLSRKGFEVVTSVYAISQIFEIASHENAVPQVEDVKEYKQATAYEELKSRGIGD